MGARHGVYCVGCCWALMALSFVFGVMSLLWMAIVTAFLLLEKATSAGPWMSKAAGIGLVAVAVWMVGRAP
jgi:predicted metal-binding membrane protein